VLIPAHRLVLALVDGEVVELRGSTSAGTFRAYRGLPDAVHGMIAWPNTVLLTGPETIVVDPGYQTQGDMLAGALAARGIAADEVQTVVMTHLHADHLSAVAQLRRDVDLHVHEAELETPHARIQRGLLDRVRVRPFGGDAGEIAPGLRWVHTPGHTPGHVAVLVDTAEGLVAIAGDTLGPDPGAFERMELPEGFPEREAHLAAFQRLRGLGPALVIPGHNPPVAMPAGDADGRGVGAGVESE
jgi:N-acyl homoserine lactone hydrolase